MTREKTYSLPMSEISYSLGMDAVRQLIEAKIEERGLSYNALSKELGHNPTYLQQFLKRGTPRALKEGDRRKLARRLGVHEHELVPAEDRQEHIDSETIAAGLDYDQSNFNQAEPPFRDAIAQIAGRMGGGSTGEVVTIQAGEMRTVEPVAEWWRVPPSVVRFFSGAPTSRLAAWPMDGDSMEPTIKRTDIVFVDTGRQSIEPDGIWAVDFGRGRTLKRIRIKRTDTGTRWFLTSDNPIYEPEDYAPEEVTIFGRYVFRFTVF